MATKLPKHIFISSIISQKVKTVQKLTPTLLCAVPVQGSYDARLRHGNALTIFKVCHSVFHNVRFKLSVTSKRDDCVILGANLVLLPYELIPLC